MEEKIAGVPDPPEDEAGVSGPGRGYFADCDFEGWGSGTEQCRERRERLRQWLRVHASLIQQCKWNYPTCQTERSKYSKAQHDIRWLLKKRKTRHLGTIPSGGRPLDVYGWRRVQHLEHEIEITDMALRYREGEWVRDKTGPERADAILTLGGRRYCVEMDTGKMSVRAAINRLLKAYLNYEGLVLFVTSSQTRLEAIKNGLEELAHVVLYTTLGKILEDPHGMIWRDFHGELTLI